MVELPRGTVTLLFTDIEGSTRLVQQLGDAYGSVLEEHRRLLREAVAAHGGHEVDCRADELFAAFPRAQNAVEAAVAGQRAICTHDWSDDAPVRVRMGLHTGEPLVESGAYLGLDVSRAARICAAANGGQILVSQTTGELVKDEVELEDLGVYSLAGLAQEERIFQLTAPGLSSTFPELGARRADRRRLPRMPRARRTGQPTLEEAAWRVRALLPQAPVRVQKPLAELGAKLFAAHRAAAGADGFLSSIDRRRLARRLADRREAAVISRRAREQADALEAQIGCIERVRAHREELRELATELPSDPEHERWTWMAPLKERLAAATADIDAAVEEAARRIDPMSLKLARTRHRGVYRSGPRYVVMFVDPLGDERSREFETLAEARNFRAALRITAKAGVVTQENWGQQKYPPGGGSPT
jgi:class 3 adenylate cyclase